MTDYLSPDEIGSQYEINTGPCDRTPIRRSKSFADARRAGGGGMRRLPGDHSHRCGLQCRCSWKKWRRLR